MFPDRNNFPMQQQPTPEHGDRRQQQAGSTEFQSKPAAQQQMGEGSYEGTKEFQNRIDNYLEKADVKKDAENARPRSEAEAREMEAAEREGRSHSKGER